RDGGMFCWLRFLSRLFLCERFHRSFRAVGETVSEAEAARDRFRFFPYPHSVLFNLSAVEACGRPDHRKRGHDAAAMIEDGGGDARYAFDHAVLAERKSLASQFLALLKK